MKLKDIMTAQVITISPEATLKEAAQQFKSKNIGSLPVCKDDRLVGIITDRDIVIRAVSEGADPNKLKVSDAMSSPINYCFDDQDSEEATKIMKDKQVRRLIVLNRKHRLCGILSLGDIAVESRDFRKVA